MNHENMVARGDFFRSLPVSSAEQNDSQSEKIKVAQNSFQHIPKLRF